MHSKYGLQPLLDHIVLSERLASVCDRAEKIPEKDDAFKIA